MKIGIVAPPWIAVPPPAYGGTEEVVDGLARGLRARGHDVVLFTVGDSTCPVDRRWYFEHCVTPMGTGIAEAAHAVAAYEELSGCEVIHDHTTLGPLLCADRVPPGVALVATNHEPFTPMARMLYGAMSRRVALVAISGNHRSTAPELDATVIHHGIDLERFAAGPGDGGYLLFIGRMTPGKGPERAIRIARAAGKPLVMAAKAREPEERDFFRAEVEPLLGPDVTLVGEATVAERIGLLQHALAVVNPICWPEPFGLVMTEALACGTPVLSFPAGAAPEIVQDGVTGFLEDDEDGLTEAVGHLSEIDRRACRLRAEEHFSMERMATDHERLYARVYAATRHPSPGSGVAGVDPPPGRDHADCVARPGPVRSATATATAQVDGSYGPRRPDQGQVGRQAVDGPVCTGEVDREHRTTEREAADPQRNQ